MKPRTELGAGAYRVRDGHEFSVRDAHGQRRHLRAGDIVQLSDAAAGAHHLEIDKVLSQSGELEEASE